MKKLIRYQCSFCKRLYAKPETVLRHEKECVSNPNGVNCFRCVHCSFDTWGNDYGQELLNHPVCNLFEESLYALKGNTEEHKSFAPFCEDFQQKEQEQN